MANNTKLTKLTDYLQPLFNRFLSEKKLEIKPEFIVDQSYRDVIQFEYEHDGVKICYKNRLTFYKGDYDRMSDYSIWVDGKLIESADHE
jgi:hypothetical protein